MANDPVTQAFDALDEQLKLDPSERDRAIRIHNETTDALVGLGVATSGFLQGSFARKTMLAPLRDIDKIIILAWDPSDTSPGSAGRAAEMVAAALRRLYPQHRVAIGKHCVTIEFADEDFTFDIVPALECNDGTGDVMIIDTEQNRWERSNTRVFISIVQQRNGECGGRWVRQVRFAKLFVRHQLNGTVKGIHIEKYAWDSVTDDMPHAEALAAILRTGAQLLDPAVQYTDPTGLDRIDHRLDPAERLTAHKEFQRAAARAEQALDLARAGEHNAAVAIWHSFLGDDFPKADSQAAIDNLGRGAGIASVVTRTAPVIVPTTRAWRASR